MNKSINLKTILMPEICITCTANDLPEEIIKAVIRKIK